ncbi:MAG TPA: molybdenum cofactor biosynthesis protein MoaE [Propionibacteriaceae bacterium]|nr:molybdenum cofactor biosynthesis protein MoaE [Propionibacteriaceae bacterium]
MSRVRGVRVLDSPLSVDRAVAAVSGPQVGGIGLFLGVVRDTDEGRGVTSLDYTGHPTAEVVLQQCAEQVAAAHDVLAVTVEHRVGHLAVGDLAVVVAVAAVHRAEALQACRQLIDDLKETVPIWKEQQFTSGETTWVGLG